MKNYNAKDIRNIVLAGHASKGKTTLAESMLFTAGATDRMGTIADGTTVCDYDAEEKKRKFSISSAVAPIEYKGKKINILDTPGLFDFETGAAEGMRAADCAVLVISARSGLDVGSEKAFKAASKRRISKIILLNKMDDARADFYKTMNAVIAKFGTSVCPVIVPVVQDGKVCAYYNMIEDKAYTYSGRTKTETDAAHEDEARFEAVKEVFSEAVAGADDELMEKYFEGEPLTREDRIHGLRAGLADGSIVPLVCASGASGACVDMLLDFIAECAPAPRAEYAADQNGEPTELTPDESAPTAAICFKTVADPFIGKLSFFKTISGRITPGMSVKNPRTGAEEKVGKIVTVCGSKQEDCKEIPAGDIGALTKLSSFATGDTMCSGCEVTLDPVAVANSVYRMAVVPEKKGDEEKIASGLTRLCEEDPALHFGADNTTHEQILAGLGEQHLDVAMAKLKAKYGVSATLKAPKIAYRETITKKVSAQGRHKKQTGGHGQFGDVWIEFEPCPCDDLEFAERVVGGSVLKNFFPAVEKGLRESIQKGVVAGYPMVGIKATLYDGSYHPVDSSEMSFKIAANLAYKNGIPQAGPVLLEPIGTLKALCNDEAMGDVIGDINKRRGRVLGMTPQNGGMQEITAEVPMGEMATFATSMRQITQGRGSFEIEFARYERVPEHIAQKIIEESKAENA